MKKLVLILGLLSLFTGPAWAQNDGYPRAEVFVGYSYLRPDLLIRHDSAHGFEISVTGNPHKNIGIEGGLTEHYGKVSDIKFSNHLLLFGPRVAGRYDKVTPWAHALLGLAHTRAVGESDNNFAFAIGGGLDANAHKNVTIRVVQADYILIRVKISELDIEGNSHNLRLSFGVVFKWGGG